MFCLRSWLPLLFIPTNASPLFILSFFLLTYTLNRPCIYCSILLAILFLSSCHWADHCFFPLSSSPAAWFEPRHVSSSSSPTSPSLTSPHNTTDASSNNSVSENSTTAFLANAVNETAIALAGAAVGEVKRRVQNAVLGVGAGQGAEREWTGLGLEWVRSWLGAREWRVKGLDVYIRL